MICSCHLFIRYTSEQPKQLTLNKIFIILLMSIRKKVKKAVKYIFRATNINQEFKLYTDACVNDNMWYISIWQFLNVDNQTI